MERTWVLEPLKKRFTVDMKAANRDKRNRSFSNASSCCEAKLKIVKRCSGCDNEVSAADCTHKLVKIGKEEHLIDGATLKGIMPEEGEIVFDTVLDELPKGTDDWFAKLDFAAPAKKHEAEYAELAEILKGRYAIGKGVFRNNEFQVVATTGSDGIIRSRRLIDGDQRNEKPNISELPEPNNQIVGVENQILGKSAVDGFDFNQFRDTRVEQEEKVIEDFVLHGKKPSKVVQEVKARVESDELERLKSLME